MIVSSFAQQYGIRIYSNDFKEMKWNEFATLLSGIDPKTALGRVVAIRAETDETIIKEFTPSMKKIHSEWKLKLAKQKTEQATNDFIESMRLAFIQMAGG